MVAILEALKQHLERNKSNCKQIKYIDNRIVFSMIVHRCFNLWQRSEFPQDEPEMILHLTLSWMKFYLKQ